MFGLPQFIFLGEISHGEPKFPCSSQEPLQKPNNETKQNKTNLEKKRRHFYFQVEVYLMLA